MNSVGRRGLASRGWLLAVALLAGCAGAGTAGKGAPARGEWRELTTDHFVLRTNVSPELAATVIQRLELDRALLVEAMPALRALRRRLEVVAHASREEFWAATGMKSEYVGLATFDAAGGQRVAIQVSPTGDAEQHEIELVHELAHALTLHVIPRQPTWLAEGLACYLSSVGRVKSGKRWLGAPPGDWLSKIDPVPVAEVFAWSGSGQGMEGRLYATAWRLVRFLSTEAPAELADLQRRLTAGEPEEVAWNAAVPRFPRTPEGLARLDRALRPWGEDLAAAQRQVIASAEASPRERLLSAAEVHTLSLRARLGRPRPELEQAVEAALAVDPGHVQALWLRATWAPADKVTLARRAVAAHPDDARAWLQLGWSLGEPAVAAEREAALRRAAELDPEEPLVHAALGFELAGRNPAAAEAFAARGRQLAPWSPATVGAHAIALARLGRCAEAARALAQGAALAAALRDDTWHEKRSAVEQSCRPGPPRTP